MAKRVEFTSVLVMYVRIRVHHYSKQQEPCYQLVETVMQIELVIQIELAQSFGEMNDRSQTKDSLEDKNGIGKSVAS